MVYTQLTKAQIVALLEERLKQNFGNDVDLSDGSVFSTIVDIQAQVGTVVYEPIVNNIYESAFLRYAEGTDLNNVVEILGITRRDAVKATGVVSFTRSSPVTTTYNIQAGTQIQTADDEPVVFETTRPTSFLLYDNWEADTLDPYDGDKSYFGITGTQVRSGNLSLEGPSSGERHMYRTDKQFHVGKKTAGYIYLTGTSVAGFTFCVQDASNYYRLVLDADADEMVFTKIEDGVEYELNSTSFSVPTNEYVQLSVKMPLVEDDGTQTFICDYNNGVQNMEASEPQADSFRSGGIGVYTAGGKTYWDSIADVEASTDVSALTGGSVGNIGANTLTELPIVPAGVEGVTNPYATGDTSFSDISGDTYVEGVNQETDPELRERTRNSIGEQGTSTVSAVETAVMGVNGVRSVTVKENATPNVVDSLPPFSFEVIAYGGDDDAIAQAIFDKKSITAQAVGGLNGDSASGEAISRVTGDVFTIDFSNPTELAVGFELTLVVTDEYIGDSEIADIIVSYIGGVLTDGTSVVGLEAGQNVLFDKLIDLIVGDETGVEGIASITSTPTASTDSNGLDVIDVASEEVASADATDSSIEITTVTT